MSDSTSGGATTKKAAAKKTSSSSTSSSTKKTTSSSSSSTTASKAASNTVAYDMFVPESSRENYREMARDRAKAEGITPKAALAKIAKEFKRQHETDPTGGWDHLAAWAADEGDPGDGVDRNAEARERARAVESARRDPQVALAGSSEAVAAAVEALQAEDDPAEQVEGVTPNPGPTGG